MKFPQYDNRPGKNKPLYSNPKAARKSFKFPVVPFSVILGVMMAIYLISHGTLDTLRSMLN
jgi:hypothetical protein